MANIHAFRAIRPGKEMFHKNKPHVDSIPEFNAGGLQHRLESEQSWKVLNHDPGEIQLEYFEELMNSGKYTLDESVALYIYETSFSWGTQIGVWALTDLDDFGSGKIITHENTLSENEDRIKNYRENVGIEGSPILLTYYSDSHIDFLVQTIRTSLQPECFSYRGGMNKLWKINEPKIISQFTEAFVKIDKVYLADGHHRLAAAWQLNSRSKQFISSLYVPSDQLKIREFHRVVTTEDPILRESFFELINRYFYKSAIPFNKSYCPDRVHRFGLCYEGLWYQLDLRSDLYHLMDRLDVNILQDYVFNSFFDIQDPKTDKRLKVFGPEEDWLSLLEYLNSEKSAIAFTLFPIEVDVFIDQADEKVIMPPKSTWIEPKIPFGLIMCCSNQLVSS